MRPSNKTQQIPYIVQEVQQNQCLSQRVKKPIAQIENNSLRQNLMSQLQNPNQKIVLIVILFLIFGFILFQLFKVPQVIQKPSLMVQKVQMNTQNDIQMEVSLSYKDVKQLLDNNFYIDNYVIISKDFDDTDAGFAKDHNVSRSQIQNAIKFSQIAHNLKSEEHNKQQVAKQLSKADFIQLQEKYQIQKYAQIPIYFCIILPSTEQNQKRSILKVLESILVQKYEDYNIVWAQSSKGKQQKLIQNFLKSSNFPEQRALTIQNSNQNILNNIFFGIQQHCKPGQIVLLINNVQSLIGINVLSLHNALYQQKKLLCLYTQYLQINPTNLKAQLADVKNITDLIKSQVSIRDYRSFNQFPMMSFYSDVFASIPIANLLMSQQKFYSHAWQKALLIPIFQLSGQKLHYLNEITYFVNSSDSKSDHKINIHYLRQVQLIQNIKQLKSIKDTKLIHNLQKKKPTNKNKIDKSKQQNTKVQQVKDSKQIKVLQKTQQQKKKQQAQFNILQRQSDESLDLEQAVLVSGHENDRNPLVSPQVVRPQVQNDKQQQTVHSIQVEQRNKPSEFRDEKSQQFRDKPYQNQHRPHDTQKPIQSKNQIKTAGDIVTNGKKSIKSNQILPVDQFGGFVDEQDIQQQKIINFNNKAPNKKKIFISGRMDFKGSNYNFDIPFQLMVNNTNVQEIFGKRKSKQGIWKNQFFQSIRKLQITNNVKYGGQIQVDLTKHDSDKFQKTERVSDMIEVQTEYLQTNYKIKQFKMKQLPFCIIVTSYNNVKTGLYLRNLNSIFMQNYTNYHVVYIDDASQDKTGQYVKSYIMSRQIPSDKIQIITNKDNRKPPFNIYNAVTNYCKLGQLAMIVEGDDALIGTNVLNLYNAIYQRDKCVMIYSSYLDIFNNSRVQLGLGHQVMDQYFLKNQIRTIRQIPSKYLYSFYVDIFKSIKVSEFKDPNGYFFWFAYDRAIITPLLQVSYPKISVLKQIVYEHRRDTDKLQSLKDWNRESGQILAKKPYKPLKFFPFIERNKYKYFYDTPIEIVIQNSDFDGYNFQNNFEIQEISKEQHIRAIRMTQLIHNVNMKGQVVVQLAEYQTSKAQKASRIQKLLQQDKNYFIQKYDIEQYKKDQLTFCILTPSYNNVKSGLYLRNLDSIFMQDYDNYHVVYIDDCSPDKTGQFVKKYMQEKNIPKQKIQVIINRQNKKALSNIHLGIHKYCKSGEIVVIIDGDDSFIGRNILSLFNSVYQRQNAAMAYSNFLTIHNNDRTEIGFCHQINKEMFQQNTFRNSWDLPGTHLLTFYSDLFKKIKISDLTYTNGTFFDYAYDRAILTPLLQMAYPRISVVKEITYEYRNDTGINDSPDDWSKVSHIILDKKTYNHLTEFPFIKGFIISTDKFNFKTSIQQILRNTDFSAYEKGVNKKVSQIAKQQHVHAIRLTELVHNINFQGKVDISLKSSKNAQKKKQRLQKLLKSDKQYLDAKYELAKYKQIQFPFCIVVSSYNSVQNGFYLRNLDSIFMQDYKNYRVVYIDDNSPDQAHQYVKVYLQDNKIPSHVLKVVINKQTRKDMANIYYAAHNQCKLDQIMLVIGANDALIGRNVLRILNAQYHKQNAKVGYSCFLKVFNSSTQLGTCMQIDEFYFRTNTFRNRLQFQKYRLMSFYTQLFRRIKITDLTFNNGTFFNNAIDKAIMTPLIQMSYPNILIAKQIMYEYRNDKISQQNQLQGTVINLVMGKKPYEKIEDFQLSENDK